MVENAFCSVRALALWTQLPYQYKHSARFTRQTSVSTLTLCRLQGIKVVEAQKKVIPCRVLIQSGGEEGASR